jgi:hypothetical protein
MEENLAIAKAAAQGTAKPEKSGKPLWLPKPSDIAWKNDRHVEDDSDTASLENSSESELDGDHVPWTFKPHPLLDSQKFIAPAVAAIAAGRTAVFEECIASMKQAMIAAGASEHSPDYDRAFAKSLTSILFELMQYHPAARMRWFAEWTWTAADCPIWKMEIPDWTLTYHSIVDNWRHDRAKLDILIEHCWHAGGGHSVGIFHDGIDALAYVLTTGVSHPPHGPDLPCVSKLPAACLTLLDQMKNVPPAIMHACRPGGDKAATVGAARLVREWIPILNSQYHDHLNERQLEDYIRLACQHDSGHTIFRLLFSKLHPDLGVPDDVGIEAAILKTERIRTHIKQVATVFGAKRIRAYLEHWPELMRLCTPLNLYQHRIVPAYQSLLMSLIGPEYKYKHDKIDPNAFDLGRIDLDILDPVLPCTMHAPPH